jgi:peptidoglycan hydrolase-like protein with peptidoglycan-binding domain
MKRKILVTALLLQMVCFSAWADPAISSAQQKLKDAGFYYGEITGEKDADTTAAIRRYQIRNGLRITGEMDAETRKSLGLASKPAPPQPRPANTPPPNSTSPQDDPRFPRSTPPPPRPPQDFSEPDDEFNNAPDPREWRPDTANPFAGTPLASAPPDVQRSTIITVQMALMRQGFYRAGIDGVYGPGMRFALRNYQARIGLEPTGRLDAATLTSLDLLPRHQMRRYHPFHRRPPPPRTRIGPGGEIIYIPR